MSKTFASKKKIIIYNIQYLKITFTKLYFVFILFGLKFSVYSQTHIQNFRYNHNSEKMRMVWDLSHNVEPKLEYDVENKTIYVIFEKTNMSNGLPVLSENPYVSSFTVLMSEDRNTKFIFHTKKEISLKNFNLKSKGIFGNRYVLDLQDKNHISEKLHNSIKQKPPRKNKYTIVLDAGHGGSDPGAIGPYGSYEKNIALFIVRRIAKALQKNPNFQVILTRQDDYFVDLQTRLAKVNEKTSDLFLSIHVDSSKNNLAYGSSTFVLSEQCALEEARKIFQLSNKGIQLAGGMGEKNLISSVVINFKVDHYVTQSYKVAEIISKRLSKVTKTNKVNVKYSEFQVLRSLKTPSVLVETDFISNPEREILLNTPKYQKKIAKGIYFISFS